MDQYEPLELALKEQLDRGALFQLAHSFKTLLGDKNITKVLYVNDR